MRRAGTTRVIALAAVVLAASGQLGAQVGVTQAPRVQQDTGRRALQFGTIDGIVTDTNLSPLRGAFVSILSSKIRVGTGPNGRFRITKVPPGQYLVIVKRGGYAPTSAVVEVPASDTLQLAYMLNPAAIELAPVVVSAQAMSSRMRDFETRRKLGEGKFMNAEEIERHNTVFATELFRNFNTINVSPSRTSSMTEYFPLSKREGGSLSMGACPMTVYMDQVALPTPFNLDLLPSPKALAGIEVYAGASTTPPQFAGYNRGCGVILVWTKDGF